MKLLSGVFCAATFAVSTSDFAISLRVCLRVRAKFSIVSSCAEYPIPLNAGDLKDCTISEAINGIVIEKKNNRVRMLLFINIEHPP